MTALTYARRRHVVTSYIPCIDESSGIQVYTSNPYTRRATSGWIEEFSQPNITFYRRQYNPKTICQEFYFDRSKKLDGYIIGIGIPIAVNNEACSSKYLKYTQTARNARCLTKRHREILDALITRLNVTVMLSIHKGNETIKNFNLKDGHGDKDNRWSIENFDSMEDDLILYNMVVRFLKNRTVFLESYPLAWEAMGIATYHRGHKTIGEKIWDFYGIWTILFTIIVLMVTFTVIWLSENRRTSFALFEIIRLLISQNLHTRMKTLPLRLFFITVLIYFLIIQATFHGHLAKFLTHPDLRKHVETLTDLNKFGYTSDRIDFPINISIRRIDSPRRAQICLRKILLNNSLACVLDHATLLYYSRKNEKLYVSEKPSEDEYYGYIVRRHAPLLKRINLFFMSLEDFGFRYLWSKFDSKHYGILNSPITKVRSSEDFHPITLEHMMFSFWILAIGLMSATISFCIEVFMTEKSKWSIIPFIKNVKNRTVEMAKRIKISWPRKIVVFFRKK
ncbi:uncharacterized protein [Chelonus insularis]|uniref:uncharacterized protein n=1 Tax=Chelonus insularis TaxID=460826 RepID=UPI00158D47A5|nr:uncharacterized protein LOC118063677 [Chelonus insularis]